MEEYDDIYGELSESGSLDISHKNFNVLDDSLFDYREKIRSLDFSYNRIQSIPPAVASLSNLISLNASCNQLASLCPEISQCVRLKVLKLNGNKIKAIPKEIGKLICLEELYLSENELEYVPESIGLLKSLRILTLQNNALIEIDAALGDCLSIESLDCSNNPSLKNIPSNLSADTKTMMWLLRFQRGLIQNYRDVKMSNQELEEHARSADKERMANSLLREENEKLKVLVDRYEDERPEMYLKIKSKVCVIS